MHRPLPAVLLALTSLCCGQAAALTPEQIARADAIHARLLTLDTHKDIEDQLAPEQLPDDPKTREEFRAKHDPSVRGTQQVDFPKMKEGGYDCAFFVVYTPQSRRLDDAAFAMALRQANTKFDAIHRMVRLHGDTIGLATSPDDVERLHREGKLIACIGIENGLPMGKDLGRIAEFHGKGARYMSITHNGHTQLGDSHTPPDKPMHNGLSELGRQAIAEMNRVGVMVDVSHAAKTTMLQAVEASKAPVIASHSGARAVNDHTRNLDDEQLKALAEKGGVVQCVALADFLKSGPERSAALEAWRKECGLERGTTGDLDDEERQRRWKKFEEGMPAIDAKHPRADVQDFVDHVDHIVKTTSIDCVGVGTDFDGGGGITGWKDASESKNLTRELVRRGYTEEQIAKIWSGNLLRVWREVEKVAAAGAR